MKWDEKSKEIASFFGFSVLLFVVPTFLFKGMSGVAELIFLIPLQILFNRQGFQSFLTGLLGSTVFLGLFLWGFWSFTGAAKDFPFMTLMNTVNLVGVLAGLLVFNLPAFQSQRILYRILWVSGAIALCKVLILLLGGVLAGFTEELFKVFQELLARASDTGSSLPAMQIGSSEFGKLVSFFMGSLLWFFEAFTLGFIVLVAREWSLVPGIPRSYFRLLKLPENSLWFLLGSIIWIIFSWMTSKTGAIKLPDFMVLVLNNISGVALMVFAYKGAGWLRALTMVMNLGPGLRILFNVSTVFLLGWTLVFILVREMGFSDAWPGLVLPIVGILDVWISLDKIKKERG